jgi:CRISPR/Cas system-associated endonuclease Cas3-HD
MYFPETVHKKNEMSVILQTVIHENKNIWKNVLVNIKNFYIDDKRVESKMYMNKLTFSIKLDSGNK